MHLEDLMLFLAREFNVSFLCDAFSDEGGVKISIKKLSLVEILPVVSSLFQRDVFDIDGIVVLSHVKGVGRVAEELRNRSLYPCEWPDAGKLTIAKKPVAKKQETRRYALRASRISFQSAATVMSKEFETRVRIDPELAQRRFHASITEATVGQIIEAMTVLLQASQQVTITQTPEQRRAAQKAIEEALDRRSSREKSSDKIRGELEKLLTPEQFEKLSRGMEVPLNIGTLPSGLRDRVQDYVRGTARENQALANLDFSRIRDFQIVFLPSSQAPTGVLGINGIRADGVPIHF